MPHSYPEEEMTQRRRCCDCCCVVIESGLVAMDLTATLNEQVRPRSPIVIQHWVIVDIDATSLGPQKPEVCHKPDNES